MKALPCLRFQPPLAVKGRFFDSLFELLRLDGSLLNKKGCLISYAAVVFFSFTFSSPAISRENFRNPFSPYPPGCVTLVDFQDLYPESSQIVASGKVTLSSTNGDGTFEANVSVTRTGCADANRSFLTIAFEILDNHNSQLDAAVLPRVYARIGENDYPFRLVRDPNTWLEDNSYTDLFEHQSREFVLDTPMIVDYDSPEYDLFIGPSQYNGAFTLVIKDQEGAEFTFDIPAYANELQASFMPFNGRLSGIWIVEGAADQGFLISFSELPHSGSRDGLIFFSWYTFDQNGNNVWLVGNSNYLNSVGTIALNLQLVTDGQFLGDKQATRLPAGSVQITARNCNLLELEYDLRQIGLGQDTVSVSRMSGIETAGYTCRDLVARLEQ